MSSCLSRFIASNSRRPSKTSGQWFHNCGTNVTNDTGSFKIVYYSLAALDLCFLMLKKKNAFKVFSLCGLTVWKYWLTGIFEDNDRFYNSLCSYLLIRKFPLSCRFQLWFNLEGQLNSTLLFAHSSLSGAEEEIRWITGRKPVIEIKTVQ